MTNSLALFYINRNKTNDITTLQQTRRLSAYVKQTQIGAPNNLPATWALEWINTRLLTTDTNRSCRYRNPRLGAALPEPQAIRPDKQIPAENPENRRYILPDYGQQSLPLRSSPHAQRHALDPAPIRHRNEQECELHVVCIVLLQQAPRAS